MQLARGHCAQGRPSAQVFRYVNTRRQRAGAAVAQPLTRVFRYVNARTNLGHRTGAWPGEQGDALATPRGSPTMVRFFRGSANERNPMAKQAKYVYFFGDGKAEGTGAMKELLGGKGANLAEMAGHRNLRLP